MSKKIIVENCKDCPYRKLDDGLIWCEKESRYFLRDTIYDPFPTWCDLPETEQGAKP